MWGECEHQWLEIPFTALSYRLPNDGCVTPVHAVKIANGHHRAPSGGTERTSV